MLAQRDEARISDDLMAVKFHPDVAIHMQNGYGDRDLRGERRNSSRL